MASTQNVFGGLGLNVFRVELRVEGFKVRARAGLSHA